MKEEVRGQLHDGISNLADGRAYVRHLLHECFNKYAEVEIPLVLGGNMNHSQEQIDAHNADRALRRQISKMLDDRDRGALEWLGRNIPGKRDKAPKKLTVKERIADYLEDCLYGNEWWFPKRKEVADKLGIDIKKVSEFYAELAEETGLNLDERSKTNVW